MFSLSVLLLLLLLLLCLFVAVFSVFLFWTTLEVEALLGRDGTLAITCITLKLPNLHTLIRADSQKYVSIMYIVLLRNMPDHGMLHPLQ